ncbi:TetR/AcrR family transcriptional regulator [Caenibius sp. WL]|uniref:TetR/AcrR family transcriptional regulator n=1 Tax=Caenibius sp. WL TaxID=2872646 RepID=UPI001C996CE2|nr:TetR/AcrR family transcriptional regulator [Caenibius sp. WL]QZP09247.1 TetR/AcrR family transcriptional regulator [Caenibius sp. WL]
MTLSECKASRRETRRQDRRDAILAVAEQYFREHGYSATTMSAIAAALGGSKGTLWAYFPSKEALFTAVVDQATTAFRAQLSATLNPEGDIQPSLRNFCLRLLEKVVSPEAIALHRLIVAEAGRFPELGRIFYERAPRLTTALLADFLDGAMKRGQLRADTPLDAAHFLMQMCVSRSQQQLLFGLTDRVDAVRATADVDRALDLFMRAYAPGQPATSPTHT